MYLHPLIHTELSRQRQHELSRLPRRSDRGSRSLDGKRAAATICALLAAAVAALAFTSGALAATAKRPSHPGAAPKGPSWQLVQDGSGKITIRIGGRTVLVYEPAPVKPLISSSTDTSGDCENYQVNCTDEQNCQYWGVCASVSNTGSDMQAANLDSSAGESTTDASAGTDNTSLQLTPEIVNDSSAGQADTDRYTDEDR